MVLPNISALRVQKSQVFGFGDFCGFFELFAMEKNRGPGKADKGS